MVRKRLQITFIIAAVIGAFLVLTIKRIDRTPFQKSGFLKTVSHRLDSITKSFPNQDTAGSTVVLEIGWSEENITPISTVPLAGYGNRKPKIMTGIEDSSYVRALVLKKGKQKAAIVTADLLIIHPVLAQQILESLSPDWNKHEIYFTATHTHSGIGGWAPGFVGELFGGTFNAETLSDISGKVSKTIKKAFDACSQGKISYAGIQTDGLVINRLVGEKGSVDPWLKNLLFRISDRAALMSFFSAHATCFGHQFTKLSGDYPARFVKAYRAFNPSMDMVAFGAGAVGSMGPGIVLNNDFEEASQMANALAQLSIDSGRVIDANQMQYYQLPIPMGGPHFRISQNFAIRPYLFKTLAGDYPAYIQVLRVGSLMMIGTPCDFSGELAVGLYQKARKKGIDLIISSFNGSYIGYVVRDEWYDFPGYESKTMSWYGPHNGSYFTEIINLIIDAA